MAENFLTTIALNINFYKCISVERKEQILNTFFEIVNFFNLDIDEVETISKAYVDILLE